MFNPKFMVASYLPPFLFTYDTRVMRRSFSTSRRTEKHCSQGPVMILVNFATPLSSRCLPWLESFPGPESLLHGGKFANRLLALYIINQSINQNLYSAPQDP